MRFKKNKQINIQIRGVYIFFVLFLRCLPKRFTRHLVETNGLQRDCCASRRLLMGQTFSVHSVPSEFSDFSIAIFQNDSTFGPGHVI